MPCASPQLAVPMPGKTKNGKTPYKFIGKALSLHTRYQPFRPGTIILPCRQCILCRLEKSRQWATRLMHEINSHPNACFLTLTYDPNQIPLDGSLNPVHLKTFFKDLRARMDYHENQKIKYFACGEYGDQKGRPHYHAALFGPIPSHPGLDPISSKLIQEEPSRSGGLQFSHPDISATWPYGLHRISELNFETAAYVARYILKKISGVSAPLHYGNLHPEFVRMSKGLGKEHFNRWTTDLYPSDQCVLPGRGAFMPPPYYDRLLEKVDPSLFQKIKKARQDAQETLNNSKFLEFVDEQHRTGKVRTLITEETLIRSLE